MGEPGGDKEMKKSDGPSDLVAELILTGVLLWFGLQVLSILP
jgi:hypothetical protein